MKFYIKKCGKMVFVKNVVITLLFSHSEMLYRHYKDRFLVNIVFRLSP
jgi:hypothetical protein